MAERWVNRDAVEWVLYEADVCGDQFPVLLVVASFTDAKGCGAYPAHSLVALLARQSRSKVSRDLAELVKQGQLRRGDWRRVVHIRSDRRPKVYDLPDKYRAWLARGVRTTPRKPPRGISSDTNGVSDTTERGVTLTPEEILKISGKAGRADAQPSAASTPPPDIADAPFAPSTKPPPEADEILSRFRRRAAS
jgi:hypothetical protein